ncbi:MAG: hypothetical protein D6802_09605 [Ardenticatenia bacterium]|nr:MAG: hypothetical protein D6802_09605 [Ardenticatenia bacterium]
MFWWFLLALFFLVILIPFFILVLLPLGLTAHSVVVLLTALPQLLDVARDRRRRRHHALEHATINVLEERAGHALPISGLAEADGFRLTTPLPLSAEAILDAAEEALLRLQRGETHLALHPRCGTTIVAGQLLFAATLLLVFLFWTEWFWVGFLVALLLALTGARPLSLVLQRFLTTDADVRGLALSHIEPALPSSIWSAFLMMSTGPTWKVVVVETPTVRRVKIEGQGGRYRAF